MSVVVRILVLVTEPQPEVGKITTGLLGISVAETRAGRAGARRRRSRPALSTFSTLS